MNYFLDPNYLTPNKFPHEPYLEKLRQSKGGAPMVRRDTTVEVVSDSNSVTILFATESGNSEGFAYQLRFLLLTITH